MAHLLLIDDDPELLPEKVRHVFPAPLHRVEVAFTHGAESGLERVAVPHPPDVILLDLRLPDQSGLEVLRQIQPPIDARIPVVFVTLSRSAESATIEAMHAARGIRIPAQAARPSSQKALERVIVGRRRLKVARLHARAPAVVAETPRRRAGR